MMVSDVIPYINFKDGTPVDIIVAAASTESRRLGSNKRLGTMETFMFMANRPNHGYNFGFHPSSFPNNPEIAERLKNGERIPRYTVGNDIGWFDMDLKNMVFSTDEKINAYLKNNILKCKDYGTINPTDLLRSYRLDENGNKVHGRMYWEYGSLFESNLDYEDMMLHYHHEMDNTLCPDGINGNPDGCLFRPLTTSNTDYGCLQLEKPYQTRNGVKYRWVNVFASFTFAGDEFSGFHKPSISGASKHMDALATMAHTGRVPMGYDFKQMLKSATAQYTSIPTSAMSIDIDIAEKWEEERNSRNELTEE